MESHSFNVKLMRCLLRKNKRARRVRDPGHYELSDRRIGMTWPDSDSAIEAAKASGASGVLFVYTTYVGRKGIGTAREVIWTRS